MTESENLTGEAVVDQPSQADGQAQERYAVQRLQLLKTVTVALGRARTSGEVADVVTTVVLHGIGANSGGLCLLTENKDILETLRLAGFPPSVMSLWKRFPLDMPAPVCDAIRQHEPIVLPSAEAGRQRYPHLENLTWPERQEAIIALPLLVDERAIGAVMFAYTDSRMFDAEEIEFLLLLTSQCAQALERTRLLEQQNARIEEQRKAEAELRRSEEGYRSLTLATTSLTFTTDARGLFTTPQTSWQAFTGQTWEEQQNWGGMNMLHSDDRDRVTAVWNEAVENKTSYDVEERIWHAVSQHYRWCLCRAIPLLHPDGTVREWIGVATDIHEKKMREQHQAFLTALNEHILPLSDPDEILWEAVNRIGPYLNLNRCHFGDIDIENDRVTLHRSYLYEATSTVGAHSVSAFGPPAFVEVLQQGRTVVVNDAATDPLISSYYAVAYRPMNVSAYIIVPCMSAGRCMAALIVDTSSPRIWTPQEIELLETVAHRIWLSVENSRLYQQAQAELKQRQAAQEALLAERERLGAIIAEMPAGVMLLSSNGKLLLANREADRIYDVPDLMAVPEDEFAVWKLFRPDGSLLPRHEYPTARSLTSGETVRNEEYSLVRRDGTQAPLLVNSAPLRDDNGNVLACVLICSDITLLKEIEAALRASETRYRTIGESGPDYVWSTDATGTPNYVSRSWAEYTRGQAEKIGEVGKSFLHPSHFDNFVRRWDEAKANGSPFETEFLYRRHDGVYRWFMARAVPVKDEQGNIQCWVGTTTNIHERKMAEDALRLHASVLENMAEGVVATDERGVIVLTNPAFDATFGYERGELTGQSASVLNAYSAEEHAQTIDEIRAAHREGKTWVGEYRNRKKDGTLFTSRALISVQDIEGKRRFIGVQEDVTERKRLQHALEQNEERSRSLVEILTALVWTTDGTGAFVSPQIAWERYTGQPWEEHQGFGWKRMLHPGDRDRIVSAWERTVAAKSTYWVEGRLWHAGSQQYRHFTAKAIPFFHPDGAIREWFGSVEDVHDTRQREEEILALNARLRLGIKETHHRVKNNLQIIGAMLDMSLMDAVDALPIPDAKRIANQIQTLAKVHDILTAEARFDRFGEDISSRSVLERLLPMLQTLYGLRVRSDFVDIPLTVQQATILALIVNELVSNAVKYGRGLVELVFANSEGQGILRVRDNGDGFPAGFDWRTAANTGLAIVEQVVRHDLGGTLRFANRTDGHGAEVCVLVPLRDNPRQLSGTLKL